MPYPSSSTYPGTTTFPGLLSFLVDVAGYARIIDQHVARAIVAGFQAVFADIQWRPGRATLDVTRSGNATPYGGS